MFNETFPAADVAAMMLDGMARGDYLLTLPLALTLNP